MKLKLTEYFVLSWVVTHLVSKLAACCSASFVSSCSSVKLRKSLIKACSSSRRCSGSPSPAVSSARAAERTRRRSESSSRRTPSSQPWGAPNSSASCCFRKPSCMLEAAWQLVQSSRMSWELWSFISVGKCRLYSCGTMFFLWGQKKLISHVIKCHSILKYDTASLPLFKIHHLM